MKKAIFFVTTAAFSVLCQAQEVGRVISSTPVMQQVAQPRNVCSTEQIVVQPQKSGAGALMGAIAGGAVGNAVGGGEGKVAATMLGIMGGAIVGDNIEAAPLAQMRNVQRCSTQTFYENRVVAYNVVYEYAGKQYSVQMPNDPGATIRLQISPVGAGAVSAAPSTSWVNPVPVEVQPPAIVMAAPVYRIYERRPVYPSFSYNYGYRRWEDRDENRHEHRHEHWR